MKKCGEAAFIYDDHQLRHFKQLRLKVFSFSLSLNFLAYSYVNCNDISFVSVAFVELERRLKSNFPLHDIKKPNCQFTYYISLQMMMHLSSQPSIATLYSELSCKNSTLKCSLGQSWGTSKAKEFFATWRKSLFDLTFHCLLGLLIFLIAGVFWRDPNSCNCLEHKQQGGLNNKKVCNSRGAEPHDGPMGTPSHPAKFQPWSLNQKVEAGLQSLCSKS